MAEYDKELSFAKGLAARASDIANSYYLGTFAHRQKSDGTSVTEADEAVNQLVIDEIVQQFPNHAILGEEQSHGDTEGAEFTWVCDPIDGTHAFMMGIPTFTFSLALTHNGKPVIAVVAHPQTGRIWHAHIGEGAFQGERKLAVNTAQNLDRQISSISTTSLLKDSWSVSTEMKKRGVKSMQLWSVVYNGLVVAEGHAAVCIFPLNKSEDVAAIKLLIEEAGGKASDLAGEDQRYDRATKGFVATNGLVHDEVIEILKPHLNLN